jgi:hypothetical protein
VEVFAKLQRRDIMQSMVTLHELVDLAEPSWRGMAETLSSRRPWDELMELDESIGNRDKEVVEASSSLGEDNLGFS